MMNSGDLMTEEEEKSNDYPSSQVNVKSDQQVVPTADSVLDGPKGAQSVMAGVCTRGYEFGIIRSPSVGLDCHWWYRGRVAAS
jgi:hypothetical protein